MMKRGRQKTGLAIGAWMSGPRRGGRSGTGPGAPRSAYGRTSGGFRVAWLAVLALWGAWSLGVMGCTSPGTGYGQAGATSGEVFANMRPSPGEISRLERNTHYYKLMGQPELGLKEVELAHEQNPDNLQITDFLARNYEELGRFEAARQLYREASSRHGPHAGLANNLCFSYYQEGRWQEAETCFRQALASDPGNVAARNNLGLLYCRLGRQDEARQLWQETEGAAAADSKINRALAALGMSDRVYAQRPGPSPPAARTTQAPNPETAVSRVPAPIPVKPSASPPPVTPHGSAGKLTARASTPTPTPVEASPGPEARKPVAITQKSLAAKAPRVVPQAAPRAHQAPLTAAELMDTAIEVRNGTWTKNLARQTRTLLSREGFTVAKIGNHIDFGAAKTIIYYRPEAERVARTVGQTLFPQAELSPSANLKKGMDIKILLGADLLQRPQLMARLATGVQ